MFNRIGFALIALALVAASPSLPPPIEQLSEAIVLSTNTIPPTEISCYEKEVTAGAVEFTKDDTPYRMFLIKVDGVAKFVLIDLSEGDDTPVWLGHIKANKLVVDRLLQYTQAHALYPDLCALAVGKPA